MLVNLLLDKSKVKQGKATVNDLPFPDEQIVIYVTLCHPMPPSVTANNRIKDQ